MSLSTAAKPPGFAPAPRPTPEAPTPPPTLERRAWARFGDCLRRVLMPTCLVCGVSATSAPGEPVCLPCREDYFPDHLARCRVCANRLPPTARAAAFPLCGQCVLRPHRFDATVALADYADPVDGMIGALKFHARLDVGWAFGWLLAQRLHTQPFDAIVALPLSTQRLRERGYNQSAEIARGIAAQLHRPVLREALIRVRHCPAQHELGLAQRRSNVRGAFAARLPPAVRHLLLVDDVLTTGSTLDAAAASLKRAGAHTVTNAVVARTP